MEIVQVNSENIIEKGFFCMRSKRTSPGYQKKQKWLEQRFEEGLVLKIAEEDGKQKGFIEYIPVESNWRGISGSNYMVIHCIWVVGRGKGNGYGTNLLNECINDAKSLGYSGVAMVTSTETWLSDKGYFMNKGFELVDKAEPCFELIVKKFDDQPVPKFNHNWEERHQEYSEGITILRSNQCPYIEDAVNTILEVAVERNIKYKVIEINNSSEAQKAPSVYGVFNVLYNGKLLTYHPLNKRELIKKLDKLA